MPSYQPVSALLRGLDVLAATNGLRGRATVGEIHRLTGIDKATIVRMLETLIHAGYVTRIDDGPAYEVTGKALLLCAGYDRHRAVGRIVAPIVRAFRDQVGWPSDVGILDGDAMLVVETSREAGPMLVNRHPGYRAPILATSLGLAYAAFCDAAEREAILAAVAADAAPWNDLARAPERSAATFEAIRRRGYATMDPAYSRSEYENRITTIGVPVLVGGRALAALNVLYLKTAVSQETALQTLLPPLQQTATRIAEELARHPGV